MKTLLLIIVIIFPILSFSQKSKLWKPGLNVYGEVGRFNSIGLGIRYGVRGHYFTTLSKNNINKDIRIRKNNGAFKGFIAKYNRTINSNVNQVELGYQGMALFGWGIFVSSIIKGGDYSVGLKPQLSISHSNFELFYNYNIPLINEILVGRHTLGLGYRIHK